MKKIEKLSSNWKNRPCYTSISHNPCYAYGHISRGCSTAGLRRATKRKDEAYKRYKAAHDRFMTSTMSDPRDPYLRLFEAEIIQPLLKRYNIAFEIWLSCYYFR